MLSGAIALTLSDEKRENFGEFILQWLLGCDSPWYKNAFWACLNVRFSQKEQMFNTIYPFHQSSHPRLIQENSAIDAMKSPNGADTGHNYA